VVQKLNPKAIPWDKIPAEDLDLLAEKIIERLISRFGPDVTIGQLQDALNYKQSVEQSQ